HLSTSQQRDRTWTSSPTLGTRSGKHFIFVDADIDYTSQEQTFITADNHVNVEHHFAIQINIVSYISKKANTLQ
ncbi:hypothetical protein JW979_16310, partial [bacterium]|nr:hypothetical protein [candidate division CSSED10-310 bacterium]